LVQPLIILLEILSISNHSIRKYKKRPYKKGRISATLQL